MWQLKTKCRRAAVEEAPENWVIYYLVKNPKDESTKRKRGDGEEIPTHFMADLMKRAIW